MSTPFKPPVNLRAAPLRVTDPEDFTISGGFALLAEAPANPATYAVVVTVNGSPRTRVTGVPGVGQFRVLTQGSVWLPVLQFNAADEGLSGTADYYGTGTILTARFFSSLMSFMTPLTGIASQGALPAPSMDPTQPGRPGAVAFLIDGTGYFSDGGKWTKFGGIKRTGGISIGSAVTMALDAGYSGPSYAVDLALAHSFGLAPVGSWGPLPGDMPLGATVGLGADAGYIGPSFSVDTTLPASIGLTIDAIWNAPLAWNGDHVFVNYLNLGVDGVAVNVPPSPWQTQDIGAVGATGNATYNAGIFTVVGNGADIFGTSDTFRMVYQPLTGDGSIVARVFSVDPTNAWAKSGVMMRDSLAADAMHVSMFVTPSSGIAMRYRATTAGTTAGPAPSTGAAPMWVKVTRSGNDFSGYYSTDGASWTLISTQTIAMGSTLQIGLALCSHSSGVLCTSIMDSVSVTTGYSASDYYVSATGSPTNNGSISSPWDLQTALNHPTAVQPGDTIWLRGGTYSGVFHSKLLGTSSSPIIVRSYPGELARIDGGGGGGIGALNFNSPGGYTWFWGLEVCSSDSNRTSTVAGGGSFPSDITVSQGITCGTATEVTPGMKIINCYIHDTRQGLSMFAQSPNLEVNGCFIYNHGWWSASAAQIPGAAGDGSGHGHGVYTQSGGDGSGAGQPADWKKYYGNVFYGGYGYGMQAYGSDTAYVENVDMQGNCWLGQFHHGPIVFGTTGAHVHNNTFKGNWINWRYNDGVGGGSGQVEMGYATGQFHDSLVDGNVIYGTLNFYGVDYSGTTFSNNAFVCSTYHGITPSTPPTNATCTNNSWYTGTYPNEPTPPARAYDLYYRRNDYDPKRLVVMLFNWTNVGTVSVDPSSVLSVGQAYTVYNGADPLGTPIASGTYGGGSLTLTTANGSAAINDAMGAGAIFAVKNPWPHSGAYIIQGA